MRDRIKDLQPTQGASRADVQPTKQATLSFGRLTKSQLINLLNGNISQPLTTEDLTNCALSVTLKWLNDVISGEFASMYELSTCLSSLEKVYKLGQRGR